MQLQATMISVGIKDYKIWTYIGMYPEELKIPNLLSISIEVHATQPDDFIDYTKLHFIIRKCCQAFNDTLENLAVSISTEIKQLYAYQELRLEINKCHPPTGSDIQSSYIIYTDFGNKA